VEGTLNDFAVIGVEAGVKDKVSRIWKGGWSVVFSRLSLFAF